MSKHKNRSLHQQKYAALHGMLTPGESKHEAKLDGSYSDYIYSYSTYHSYSRHSEDFLVYMRAYHPEYTTLEACRPFVAEYLDNLVSTGIFSAHTIHLKAKALNKLFKITPDDPDYYHPPKRYRKDITRSRNESLRRDNFSVETNSELISFSTGTGLRRHELALTSGDDLYSREEIYTEIVRLSAIPKKSMTRADRKKLNAFHAIYQYTHDEQFFVYVPCGKGGLARICPIIGDHVDEIVTRYRATPAGERLWPHIHSGADIHGMRARYAAQLYRIYARAIEDIPYDKLNKGSNHMYQSDVYVARNDMRGLKFDRKAMQVAAKALGHNRVSVIASNYLWAL